MCRFYGNQGYQIYYEHDLWYTSACQYCTCRRHNRIICKSIQCEHQFCLEHEIREARSDTCCVSCRQARQCNLNGHILKVKSMMNNSILYWMYFSLKERSYHQIDNCTLCTCTSERQPECYSNCNEKGYSIIQLKTSSLQRNHTITITDSLATIIACMFTGDFPVKICFFWINFRFKIWFNCNFDENSFTSISIFFLCVNNGKKLQCRCSTGYYS
jgi:hypothetical protein